MRSSDSLVLLSRCRAIPALRSTRAHDCQEYDVDAREGKGVDDPRVGACGPGLVDLLLCELHLVVVLGR
jgi:hypothetical protein